MNRFVRWRPCWSPHAAIVPLVARRRGPVVCVPRARAGASRAGVALSFALAAAGVGVARAQPSTCYYTYTQIPNPPGWSCVGQAINNHGHVAGYTSNTGDTNRAFVWSPESGTTLLPSPPGIHHMRAYDLNDHGHVVGVMEVNLVLIGYVWDGQTYTMITPPAWANSTEAYGINNDGRVVGTVRVAAHEPIRAFRWHEGTMEEFDLDASVSASFGTAIDEVGGSVGRAFGVHGASTAHAFAHTNGLTRWLDHPAGIATSEANGCSNNGSATGFGTPVPPGAPGYRRLGLVWSPQLTSVVSAPAGSQNLLFWAVNDAIRAVGYFDLGASGPVVWQHGVLVDARALVSPVSPPGFTSLRAINRRGQMVGRMTGAALVLTPHWLLGDVTGDCHVTLDDLILVLRDFGAIAGSFPRGDVDADGDVDLWDLATLLSNWGR